jgi:hypothetical protein
MWKNPDSLVAMIMKAKYHPKCAIREALQGILNYFFFLVWKNIQSTYDLVKEGLVCMIRNGTKVQIWEDRWLPTPSTFWVQSIPTLLDPTTTIT